jgi:hypothetical protein
MSCCGTRRRAWQGMGVPQTGALRTDDPGPRQPEIQSFRVVYHLGDSSLLIKGPVTGSLYLFAGRGEGLSVQERDVPGLLSMGFFKL